jgi:predicted 2-oxoglutarate/Fe(II)-dependent dioxygenase YbiX
MTSPERSLVDRVFVRPSLWDAATCARVRAAMDHGRPEPAEIYRGDYVVDADVRRTLDIEVDAATICEVEQTFERLRGEVSIFFGTALTGAEGPGFLRYLAGGFYRAHQDALEEAAGETHARRISVVLFLTTTGGRDVGRCEGGALRLCESPGSSHARAVLDIVPVAGTFLAFPSCTRHEVLPVTAGIRDVIVDWFF